MEATNKITSGRQPTPSRDSKGVEKKSTAPANFDRYLRGLLGNSSQRKVSEEELYSAIAQQRIQQRHGDTQAKQYQAVLSIEKSAAEKPSFEQAANKALDYLSSAKILSPRQTARVKRESFAAAQLDSNRSRLYDGQGSETDKTVAVSRRDRAIDKARNYLFKA